MYSLSVGGEGVYVHMYVYLQSNVFSAQGSDSKERFIEISTAYDVSYGSYILIYKLASAIWVCAF